MRHRNFVNNLVIFIIFEKYPFTILDFRNSLEEEEDEENRDDKEINRCCCL